MGENFVAYIHQISTLFCFLFSSLLFFCLNILRSCGKVEVCVVSFPNIFRFDRCRFLFKTIIKKCLFSWIFWTQKIYKNMALCKFVFLIQIPLCWQKKKIISIPTFMVYTRQKNKSNKLFFDL